MTLLLAAAALLVFFSTSAWARIVTSNLYTNALYSCWNYVSCNIFPVISYLLKERDFVVNIMHVMKCIVCFEFYDFFAFFFALFCAENLKAVPLRFAAPVFCCLAVNFADSFAFFAGIDDVINFVLYIRSVAGAHTCFGSRSFCFSFDDWFTAFAVCLARTTWA